MKTTIVAAVAVFACTITGVASENREYFMYPDAIALTGGEAITSRFKPSENWVAEKKEGAPHFFRGRNKGASGIEVLWEFVRRTEHGDVYLIVISHPERGVKKIPLLFEGKQPVEAGAFGAFIRIQNEKGD